MPYIKKSQRLHLDFVPEQMANPGDLNYLVTQLLKTYLEQNGKNYTTINDCLGALEGAKLEFYRRVVVAYENAKLQENGDVY